jgi:hypothetical protein
MGYTLYCVVIVENKEKDEFLVNCLGPWLGERGDDVFLTPLVSSLSYAINWNHTQPSSQLPLC